VSDTPNSAPERRRFRIWPLALALIIVIVAAFYIPVNLLAPVGAATAAETPHSVPATVAPTIGMPHYGSSAISAIGYPGLLASAGSRHALPIGSITKIVTALVVLEKKPLSPGEDGPDITFTKADVAIRAAYLARNGEVYPVRSGAKISERDVLTIALVASANNYARALVDWAFGSEANFLPVAKAWLTAHGMASTRLTDCTGMNPSSRSTPTDLIAIGKLALANPLLAALVNTRKITEPVVGKIVNTNKLLGRSGVHGIKTGSLDSAGASLLFESDFTVGTHRLRLIGAVLDGPDHPTIDAKVRAIIAKARAAFVTVPLVKAGQSFGSYTTKWGGTSGIVASRSASIVLLSGTGIHSSVSLEHVTLARKGSTVGHVTFSVRGVTQTVPLILTKSLVDPGPWWRLTHPGQLS
jgi:D-alanyl-D-alanine carboxypeptidase (penicillin-binding protein 5/6)